MKRLFQKRFLSFAVFYLFFAFVITTSPVSETVSGDSSEVLSTPDLRQRELIQKIRMINNRAGYALTTTRLLQTTDSGATWRDASLTNAKHTIHDAFFLDESNGWALLSSENLMSLQIANTKDSANWKTSAINLSQEALADFGGVAFMDFVDAKRGWLMLKQMASSNFSRGVLLSTNNGGETWQELPAPPIGDEINFISENVGFLAGGASGDKLFITRDGGRSWNQKNFQIETQTQIFQDMKSFINTQVGAFPFTMKTSDGLAVSVGKNQIKILKVENNLGVSVNSLLENETITQLSFNDESNGFVLTSAGRCAGYKTNCIQETRLLSTKDGGRTFTDSTPPLNEVSDVSIERIAGLNTEAPPGGATHISSNLGFDKCTAAPSSQMQTWWDNSPFRDVNIYSSGSNRGCSQPQLTAQWVDQVSTMGWGLIPTHVGLQSPCSSCTNCAKHSTDPATAEQQGRAEADTAHNAAVNLGMATGTIVYFDMERYTDTGNNVCRNATRAFLNGWTQRMHELGDKSGVYGSPCNAREDWIPGVINNIPDSVWMARWLLPPKFWDFLNCPIEPNWTNRQRIHQYQGPHNETWGSVTFNIDKDIADGPVVGVTPTNVFPFHLPHADFDSDGKTDISIWRPSDGVWYVLRSTNFSYFAAPFGVSTDKIMPGDFDGDGITDFGVYRPSEGVWYVLQLGTNTINVRQFGIAEDIPVTDDFDADTRTDYAVFRPSNATWYIYTQSNRTTNIIQFGQTGDVPVAGDYDGDGKADIAVWRPTTGVWHTRNSSNGFVNAIPFGLSTDKPVEGDYDGDGKWDLAVYRPSEGNWYMMRSTLGFGVVTFGLAEDIPATGDYDGDKKFDQAVFRPSTGIWYLWRSQLGFLGAQFGQTNDRPIPTAYSGTTP